MSVRNILAIVAAGLIAILAWPFLRAQLPGALESKNVEAPANADPAAADTSGDKAAVQVAPGSPTPAAASAVAPASPSAPQDRTFTAEERENLRINTELEFDYLYEDIGETLGLDAADAENLVALLIEHRLRYAESFPGHSADVEQARAGFQTQMQREIEAQIGAERARKLAEYQRSLQVRYEVENQRKKLDNEAEALALTESQRKQWIQRGIERGAYAGPTVFTGAESELALTQELNAKNEIAFHRLMDAARGVLTSAQLARLDEMWRLEREGSEQHLRDLEKKQAQR